MTPPSTHTVLDALTTPLPEVFGKALQPVTIAHIIALEKAGCQLVLGFKPPTTLDVLVAVEVLQMTGADALAAARDIPAITAGAEAMALAHGPGEIPAATKAVSTWLSAAYDTHVAAANDTDPLASRPDGAASAGR